MVLDFTRSSISGIPENVKSSRIVEGSYEEMKEDLKNSVPVRWFKVEGPGTIKSVCVLPPRDAAQERKFQLHLRFGSKQDPSSQLRRTGNVEGLELEVEEKDLQPLSRLVGRRIIVHYLTYAEDLRSENLLEENRKLKDQIQNLSRRLRAVQDQLQFAVENQIRDSR